MWLASCALPSLLYSALILVVYTHLQSLGVLPAEEMRYTRAGQEATVDIFIAPKANKAPIYFPNLWFYWKLRYFPYFVFRRNKTPSKKDSTAGNLHFLIEELKMNYWILQILNLQGHLKIMLNDNWLNWHYENVQMSNSLTYRMWMILFSDCIICWLT